VGSQCERGTKEEEPEESTAESHEYPKGVDRPRYPLHPRARNNFVVNQLLRPQTCSTLRNGKFMSQILETSFQSGGARRYRLVAVSDLSRTMGSIQHARLAHPPPQRRAADPRARAAYLDARGELRACCAAPATACWSEGTLTRLLATDRTTARTAVEGGLEDLRRQVVRQDRLPLAYRHGYSRAFSSWRTLPGQS